MAEAVGLAASVAGLLSLGLQITGGIATYLDALESRQDELASIKRQNDSLSSALDIIKTATSRFQSSPHDRAVTTGIQSCEAELQAIEVLLADLANCDTSTWRQRFQSTKKKLSYAFDRSKVQQLAQRLHHANEILQLTLTGLGLDLSGSSIDKLDVIESTSRSHASELLLLRSEVAAAITPATDMRNQMPLLQSGIDATSHLVVSHSTITSNQIQQSSQATLHSVERSHNSLQLTLGLQLEKMERLEQLLEGLRSNNPRDQSVESLARRAASKPATLKELCDSVHAPGHDPKHHMSLEVPSFESGHEASSTIEQPRLDSFTRGICICHRLHLSLKHRRIQLGHFSLSQELENHGHWPGCPLSKSQSPRKNRRAAGLQFTGLSRMLQSVIGISFSMTSGAGGFSIGPSFTYYPTVNPRSDRAFIVLELVKDITTLGSIGSSIEPFLLACIRKLARLFDERKAWPNAMTLKSGNLIHKAILLLWNTHFFGNFHHSFLYFFPKLIGTLLDYGVPAFNYDYLGRSPLLMISDTKPWGSVEIIKLLVQANLESKSAFVDRSASDMIYRPRGGLKAVRGWYKLSPGYVEACECGPLSTAVVYNNLSEITRILDRSPESLSEVDIYAQGPLHLATSKARILRHLLKFATPNQMNQRDGTGVSVLETAMMLSSSLCINGSSNEICHGCDCVACVDLLLEAGCEARMNRKVEIWMQPILFDILEPASELARRRYISHMKGCQAHQPFPFLGNTHPQDYWQIPEDNFPSINASTATVEERLPNVRDKGNLGRLAWVYEEIPDTHMASLFYSCGISPAQSFPRPRFRPLECLSHIADYLFWLLQHGVDLHLEISTGYYDCIGNQDIVIFGAHCAFYLLGRQALHVYVLEKRVRPFYSGGKWTEVAKSVIRDNLTDGCKCYCLMVGCDPFIWLLKGMVADSPPSRLTNLLGAFYHECGIELTALTFEAAIRHATFQALKITHTCCDAERLIKGHGFRIVTLWLDKNEVKTINEEQAYLLKLHEELVAEFQEKASEYIKEGSDDSPRFPLFWSEYWIVRITEELQKLDGANLSDGERRGAEDIGVHWCEPPDDKGGATNPYDERTLEHWFFELDSVCPELSEPWPEGLRRVDELP